MKLWIARHGSAGPHVADPAQERDRDLTDDGRDAVEAVASELAKQPVQPRIILASNYARVAQTADAFGGTLGVQVDLVDELNPHMPMDRFLSMLLDSDETKRVMIVAHVDNTSPTMNALDGDMGDCARDGDDVSDGPWPPLVKGEVRYVGIDRGTGAWQCRWRCTPSDVGFDDEA